MEHWANTAVYGFVIGVIIAPVFFAFVGIGEIGKILGVRALVLISRFAMAPLFLVLLFGMYYVAPKAAANRVDQGFDFLVALRMAWAETRADLSRVPILGRVIGVTAKRTKGERKDG